MAARYRVTAPYVTAKVPVDGGTAIRGFYADAVFEADEDAVAHLLRKGMVEKVVVVEDDASAATVEDAVDAAPAKSAPKADWEAYARAQGATDADLDGATKDDLIAAYGDQA